MTKINTTYPSTENDVQPSSAALRAGTVTRAALLLSTVTLALTAVACIAGLLLDNAYPEPTSTSSMLRAYDLVTLVVVVPTLTISLIGVRRGSVRAQLLWVAMLAANLYTYAYYVFPTAFNDLFLLHIAVFSASLFALIMALAATDAHAVAERFNPRTPTRWISTFLALLALGLGGMWIANSVRFAFTDALPTGSMLVETDALVHLGFVLDLTLLVPGYAVAAVLLWRRAAWGYLLAALLIISGLVHQIGYLVAMPFQVTAHVPDALALDPGEPVIAALFLAATVALLVNVRAQFRKAA